MNEQQNGMMPPAAYVNFLRVAHQKGEFFLAFGQLSQEGKGEKAHLVSSLVTTPSCAKAMARALMEAVARYEARHGEIADSTPAGASAGANGAEEGKGAEPA